MKLYHGSTVAVRRPLISRGRPNTDFGKGFYATTSFEQAERWAHIRKERSGSERAVVSVFEFDESLLDNPKYKVRRFNGVDREWLQFIVGCRKLRRDHDYNLVMGPVANDRLYLTINMYENGELSEEATIIQLKAYKLFDQLSFHSTASLRELHFLEAVEV
ncbi:MAG: DUF3990 domain-containing protein [Bacteroidales bacterium]|nr:DUF3990 domain-containing protein [Bacteroidales bacterium]